MFLKKSYTPNWSEKVIVVKKVKIITPWTCFMNDLNRKEIVGTFYQTSSKKQIKNNLELKK